MAANRNRYADNTLTVQKDGVNYQNLIAIHATDYVNEGTIKQLFHLDYVHKVQDGYFIGGIKVSGSGNLKFHDTRNKNVDGTTNSKGDAESHQRLSHLRVRGADGVNYALFNDAGLNTKPNCETWVFENNDGNIWVTGGEHAVIWKGNTGRLCFRIISAFFANTTGISFTLRGATSGVSVTGNRNSLDAQVEEIWQPQVDGRSFTEGETINGTMVVSNEEGSITISFTTYCREETNYPILVDKYDANSFGLIDLSSRESVTIYTFTNQLGNLSSVTVNSNPTGIYLYTDWRMNLALSTYPNYAEDGYYDIGQGDGWLYQVVSGQVMKKIEFGSGGGLSGKVVLSPIIDNDGNVAIEVQNNPATSNIVISYIYYYNTKDGDSQGTQSLGSFTIPSGTGVGQSISTGLTPLNYPYAACVLQTTNINVVTPISMLMNSSIEK